MKNQKPIDQLLKLSCLSIALTAIAACSNPTGGDGRTSATGAADTDSTTADNTTGVTSGFGAASQTGTVKTDAEGPEGESTQSGITSSRESNLENQQAPSTAPTPGWGAETKKK